MNLKIVLITCWMTLSWSVASEPQFGRPANTMFIFDHTKVNQKKFTFGVHDVDVELTWTPTRRAIGISEKAIYEFLTWKRAQPARDAQEVNVKILDKIILRFDQYRVQCFGFSRGESKLLHMNYFPPADRDGDRFRNAGQNYVQVMDGGHGFWRIVYDPVLKKVTNFEVNGSG